MIMQQVLTFAPPERGANHLTLKLKIAIPGWAQALLEPSDGLFFWVGTPNVFEAIVGAAIEFSYTFYDICWYHLSCRLKVEPVKKGGHGQCDDVSRSSSLPSESSVALLH